jgi:hypothetical protein
MSVEKDNGNIVCSVGAIHFSAIAIQNEYPGIAPTAQKSFLLFYYRHFAPKGAAFMKKLR